MYKVFRTYKTNLLLRCLVIFNVALIGLSNCLAENTIISASSFDSGTLAPGTLAPGTQAPGKLVNAADSAYFSQFRYIRLLGETQSHDVSDIDFYQNAQKVTFVVAKYDINQNSPAIRELVEKIIPRINADSLELHFMTIRGAASPDGPYAFNQKLGKNRSLALFDFINKRLKFPAQPGRYSQESVAEDYIDLLRMLRDANDPNTEKVTAIVEKYNADANNPALKRELQTVDKGTLWQYLNTNYFPQLRSAKVMFFFKKYIPRAQRLRILAEPVKGARIAYPPLPELTPGTLEPVVTMSPVEPDTIMPTTLIRRHILALRTNLLYDFFYMPGHYWAPSPNIQVEYYPKSGHFTTNFSLTYPHWHWWNRYQFWQIHDYMLEERYYFKGKGSFIGPYVSAYAHVNKYGIGFSKTKGWEGEGYGAGLMAGYVVNISRNRRWRLEFSVGVGYYETRYDPYVYGNPLNGKEDGLYYYDYTGTKAAFKERNHRFRWIGPTNIGIHLTYDLLFRRIQKRGVSFNRSEKVIPEQQRTKKVSIDQKGGWKWIK